MLLQTRRLIEKSEVLGSISELLRRSGSTIGFVPTMGALHTGHLELVKRSVLDNDITVVSIFVNPTQFNDKDDLRKYPRELKKDVEKLNRVLKPDDIIFTPSVTEMYPVEDDRVFDFQGLDETMEGKFRPGHFNGVAQIVSKFFDLIKPHKAYFGKKDFQQLAIISQMAKQMHCPVEVIACPTIREDDGLAMSSRNILLSEAQRKSASLISQTLIKARELVNKVTVDEVIVWVVNEINRDAQLETEYFKVADSDDLSDVIDWEAHERIVGCIAVRAGSVRLIDNIELK